jgi:hypothetical protein
MTMKLAVLLLFALAAMTAHHTPPIPVLVELFTSEGCSSCPPADELLRKLQAQPVDGVQLITLSEHVDYWDYIGWKDPNGSRQLTARQNDYAKHFVGRGSYTPQMVVDGEFEFVGSDTRALARAVEQAVNRQKTPLKLALKGRALSITIEGAPPPPGAEMILAVTQNGVASSVTRGENSGRRLLHDSVVRHWQSLGDAVASKETLVPAGQGDKAVVFLQDKRSRRVLGVASIGLP